MQVVFDFDCTLTSKIYFLFMTMTTVFCIKYNVDRQLVTLLKKNMIELNFSTIDTFISLIFGSKERLNNIKKLLSKIPKNDLFILSYSFKWQILLCLKYVDLLQYFNNENIFGFENIKKKYLWIQSHLNKNLMYIDDISDDHNKLLQQYTNISCIDYHLFKKYFINNIIYYFFELKKESTGLNTNLINIIYDVVLITCNQQ